MDSTRQEYPALLASLQPEQAINVLHDRVDLITKVNTDIADWLQERRKVEEAYVSGLRKLARRPQQDGASALGVFQMPWQRIVSGTENLALSHETLASKIETDVETPLRYFSTKNREAQSLSTVQGNLTSIAKEFGNAQKKAEKKSSARPKLDDAGREWESQAPFVFEQLQALDETRVNHLRDVLTQFQTHELDQVERNRASAESCLNALLNVETADEIKTFAARVAAGRGSIPRPPSSTAGNLSRPMSSNMGPPPTPPPPRLANDRFSQRSGSDAGQDRLAPLQENTPKKSSLGGLKRLGTVMSRRKSTAPPPPPSSSEKRKEKGRSFVPFRRGDSSRSFQDLESTGQDLTPVQSSTDEASRYRQPSSDPPETQRNPDVLSATPFVNGASQPRTPDISETTGRSSYMIEPEPPQLQQPLQAQQPQPIQQAPPQELSAIPSTPEYTPSSLDRTSHPHEEPPTGYSEPDDSSRNLKIRDQPIPEDESAAQQAMNNTANMLRMQAQSSGLNRLQGSVRGRRDVRNTMFASNTASTPEAPGTSGSSGMGQAGWLAAGGAAAAGATSYAASDLASPTKGTTQPAPVLEATTSPILSSPVLQHHHTGMSSDSNSIHSSHSLAGGMQHPELTEAGLNASIVETVNTWFDAEGNVSRSFVVGEVALAHNHNLADSSDKDTETIRLEHFEVVEKVAANPTFINSISSPKGKERDEEKAGEYSVQTSAIRRSTPTVALKYQLHVNQSNLGAYSPLVIKPAWQLQDGQASVIIGYGPNPVFGFGQQEVITLRNVVISVGLDVTDPSAGRATSAMMKPTEGASFRRKASSVVWRIGEVRLAAGEGEKQLIVRLMTSGGMPRRGGVEVKFEVVGRGGSGLGITKKVDGEGEMERDPFADSQVGGQAQEQAGSGSGQWVDVPTWRKLVAGRYTAA